MLFLKSRVWLSNTVFCANVYLDYLFLGFMYIKKTVSGTVIDHKANRMTKYSVALPYRPNTMEYAVLAGFQSEPVHI